MRLFPLLIISILLSASLSAQNIPIKPGHSAGEIKIGMSQQDVCTILGGDFQIKNYEEEKTAFDGNYNISTLLQFKIGFDSVVVYSDSFPKYPFFKLYFKNNRLNYYILTSYGADENIIKRYILPKKIRFGDKKEKVLRKYKKPTSVEEINSYDGDYTWEKKGIELLFDTETGLSVVYIFTPLK
ncbi:MAG: hypothetical protein V2A54_14980 [Bacteroidota bacterium]